MMMKMGYLNDEEDNDNRRQQQQQQQQKPQPTNYQRPWTNRQPAADNNQQTINTHHLQPKQKPVKSFHHYMSISSLEVLSRSSMIDAYPGYYSPNVPQRRGRVQQGSY